MYKEINKKLLSVLLSTSCVFSANILYASAYNEITVMVNDKPIQFDQSPIIEDGCTLVPFRAIFEAIGADVNWDDTSKTVSAVKSDTEIKMTIGENNCYVNASPVQLDVPAKIINDTTLVPVRFISESLGYTVEWDDVSKTVLINENNIASGKENVSLRDMTVHYIDVGQADSILINLPNGQNMLIDAGNNADGETVVNYVKSHNIDTLDYVIGTHPHEDHIGGLDDVIYNFNIGEVYMPKLYHNTKTFNDVITAIESKGLAINTAKSGVNILNENDLDIDIIAPVYEEYESLNDYSAVIRLRYIDNTFLFMGDAEILSENSISEDVNADVIKIGHHGSNTSSSMEFLKRVSPKYAVISVGNENSYGHPDNNVITRLNDLGADVFRTDTNGTVIITSDGKNISVGDEPNKIPKFIAIGTVALLAVKLISKFIKC